jgi:hypothetical protein
MADNKEIKDGVYGFVSGTVGRAFNHAKGRAFEMEVKDDRQQYGDKWTIWGDLNVSEGDRVSVKGWLSISRETYEKDGQTKVAIKRAVNNPEIAAHEARAGAPARQEAGQAEPWANVAPTAQTGAGDVWNQPSEYDSGTPF